MLTLKAGRGCQPGGGGNGEERPRVLWGFGGAMEAETTLQDVPAEGRELVV